LLGSDKLTPAATRRGGGARGRRRRAPRQSTHVWRASQTWRRIGD